MLYIVNNKNTYINSDSLSFPWYYNYLLIIIALSSYDSYFNQIIVC